MGFLADRKILITGILSNRSIAYGIAKACRREGAALAFTYVNDELRDRVTKIATEFGDAPVLRCDVTSDEQIAALFDTLKTEWGALDGLLHSIAFAPREALSVIFWRASTSRHLPPPTTCRATASPRSRRPHGRCWRAVTGRC